MTITDGVTRHFHVHLSLSYDTGEHPGLDVWTVVAIDSDEESDPLEDRRRAEVAARSALTPLLNNHAHLFNPTAVETHVTTAVETHVTTAGPSGPPHS